MLNIPLLEDSIFIGAEGFANYYNNSATLNYSYGLKGTLGYSIALFDLYGFYGHHYVNLDNEHKDYFIKIKTPIYGYGIAYGLGLLKIKFETSYFELEDKLTRDKKEFKNAGFIAMFSF